MEKLTGTAWLATESIPLETLKHPEGVKRLMDHLWKELGAIGVFKNVSDACRFL